MVNKINIEIDGSSIGKITYEDESGRKINKYINYKELVKIINASTVTSSMDESIEVGFVSSILPNDNIIRTLAVKEIKSSRSIWYVLLRDNAPHDMDYRGTKYKNVGMPKMIFVIKVFEGRCVKMGISCVKGNHIDEYSEIYQYPFSNVFGARSVCLGGNSISTFDLKDSTSVRFIPDMFLAMPNNNHGFQTSRSNGKEYDEFLNDLQEKNFNDDILLKDGSIKTLNDLINGLN